MHIEFISWPDFTGIILRYVRSRKAFSEFASRFD
jgi:hypothetical protein